MDSQSGRKSQLSRRWAATWTCARAPRGLAPPLLCGQSPSDHCWPIARRARPSLACSWIPTRRATGINFHRTILTSALAEGDRQRGSAGREVVNSAAGSRRRRLTFFGVRTSGTTRRPPKRNCYGFVHESRQSNDAPLGIVLAKHHVRAVADCGSAEDGGTGRGGQVRLSLQWPTVRCAVAV